MRAINFIKQYHKKPLYLGFLILAFLYSLFISQSFAPNSEVSSGNINKDHKLPNINSLDMLKDKKLYYVSSVVDGDTIDININGSDERVRLIGINTPETVDPRRTVECFGKEASDKSNEKLLNRKVYLEDDPSQSNKDKYDRLLRYIYLEDGTNFNYWLVNNGYAYEYTYNVPYRFQLDFKNAQKYAQDSRLGLWNQASCAN